MNAMAVKDREHGGVVIHADPLALLVFLNKAAHQCCGGDGRLHTVLGVLNSLQTIELIAEHQLFLFGEDSLLLGRTDRGGCRLGGCGDQARRAGECGEQQKCAAETSIHVGVC